MTFNSVRSKTGTYEVAPFLVNFGTLGQVGMSINVSEDRPITSICITSPYGRFGNNFYQVANAAVIAKQMGVHEIQYPQFEFGPTYVPAIAGDTLLTSLIENQGARHVLSGSFYAPVGLDSLFEGVTTAHVIDAIDPIAQVFYEGLIDKASRASKKSLAAHFRGGDIFSVGPPAHPWYVQPPAAYYIYAITHALKHDVYEEIRLVIEDRTNPAVEVVEAYLTQHSIAYVVEQQTLEEDLVSLLAASCLVSSSSTLPEAVSFISRRAQTLYSFRSNTSQLDFAPFVQSRVGEAFKLRGGRTYVINDAIYQYIPQKSWINSEEQRRQIVEFDIRYLRLYSS